MEPAVHLAFSGRPSARSRCHIVTDVALSVRRLRRAAGDPLCRPATAFTSRLIRADPSWVPTCPQCIEFAARPDVADALARNLVNVRRLDSEALQALRDLIVESDADRDVRRALIELLGDLEAAVVAQS